MYSSKLCFNNGGKFKIMQLADIQELPQPSADTIKLLNAAIEKEKPDLIVFTGDQIYGLSPTFRIGSAENNVKGLIEEILKPVENANIPFAVTFGNHDAQSGVSNTQQAEIYSHSPCYVSGDIRDSEDRGTCAIGLYSQENERVFDLFLIDSNGQTASGEYLPVRHEQLEWFRNTREKSFENTGKYLPAIVFQHIPCPEFYNVLQRVKFGTKGAVEAFRTHRHEFYTLPESIRQAGGFMLESPAVPDKNSGEFNCLKEKKNVLALCVGHDHNNSFEAELDGIKLIYTQCAGFNVYGPGLQRGVRIINLDIADLNSFETHTLTFGELCGNRLSSPVKEFVLTHIPSSMEQIKRLAALGISATALGGAALGCYLRNRKK